MRGNTHHQIPVSFLEGSDAAPVFNKNRMLEILGSEKMALSTAETFLLDTPTNVEKLKRCLAGGDLKGVERRAHSIKGTSAYVGGESTSEAADEMEKAARNGDGAGAAACLPKLETQIARLEAALRSCFNI